MDAIHRTAVDRIKGWARTHPRKAKLLLAASIAVVITLVIFIVSLLTAPKPTPTPIAKKTEPTPEPIRYYSPLTGMEVKDEKTTTAAVTAIMIENSPDARPQSGLKEAGVVYEAIAEGGITRFLALYQESKPQLIGPVRSLRMYYVDWLAPYQASVAHVGGSYYALREIRNGSYRDIDQFFNAAYYWRATDRWAPHNVYTSFKKLDALNKKKGYRTSKFESWPRIDGKPTEKPSATKINVTISGPLYNSTYTYDKEANVYKRSQADSAHRDREKGRITPSVVIVMYTTMNKVFEDGWREDIKTTGSGKAYIFQGGTVTKGKWVKKNRKSQIQFVNSEGEEIELFRGQTWITAVPENQGGKVTWQ